MRALEYVTSRPWLISEAGLDQVLEIAARQTTDTTLTTALERKVAREQRRSIRAGQPVGATRYATIRDGVAVLPVIGTISRYADIFSEMSGAVSVEALMEDFQTLLLDPSVRAIVMTFDTPGGDARGIHEFADLIYAARETKRVIAYVGEEACSGGLWLATACSEVVMDAAALMGSLGAVITMPDPTTSVRRTIKFVAQQSPNKQPDPTTASGAAQIQQIANDLAGVFVASVARNRNVSEEVVLADFGQGAVFVGQQAVAAGLADRLGSFEQVLAELQTTNARPGGSSRVIPRGEQSMDWKGFWSGMFKAAKEEGVTPEVVAETETATAVATSSDTAELLQVKAALVKAQEERIEQEAQSFVASLADRITPAEATDIAGLYIQAAQDDVERPLTAGSRVAAIKTAYAARPTHRLTEELIPADAAVLENPVETPDASADKPMTEARRAELLRSSPLGQRVLQQRTK